MLIKHLLYPIITLTFLLSSCTPAMLPSWNEKMEEATNVLEEATNFLEKGTVEISLGNWDEANRYFNQAKDSYNQAANKYYAAYELAEEYNLGTEKANTAYDAYNISLYCTEVLRNNYEFCREFYIKMKQLGY